jgi:molybdate transport system regulatory protein
MVTSKAKQKKLEKLKPETKIAVYAGKAVITTGAGKDGLLNEKMFELLSGVKTQGSLNASTKSMKIAYSWAWKAVNEIEKSFGFTMIERDGARGSVLTKEAEVLLDTYEQVKSETIEFADRRYKELLAQRLK